MSKFPSILISILSPIVSAVIFFCATALPITKNRIAVIKIMFLVFILSLFNSKNFSPSGPNYTHFTNGEFDELYQETMIVSNPEERTALYKKMDRLMMSQYPIIPLYYDQAIRFTRKNVHGLEMNAINLLNLKRVQKSN